MWGRLLVLSLLARGCQAFGFLGTVVTYDPYLNNMVFVRHKVAYQKDCLKPRWSCLSGNCTSMSLYLYLVTEGPPCQLEARSYHNLVQTSELLLLTHDLQWIAVNNNVTNVEAITRVNTWTRSDTGKANASPRGGVLPVLRVPSNCARKVALPTFDPDGDAVACHINNDSVLILSPDCNLDFIPASGIKEGAYAMQVIMEDYPRQNITLTNGVGKEFSFTTKDFIGQIPIQFVLMVDPPVVSCLEGVYFPVFLPPTPANGDHLYTSVNETLEIAIHFSVQNATNTTLLFSGPTNMTQTIISGHYLLLWTPTESDWPLSHSVCFVVQTVDNLIKRDSEMRCVIVTVQPVVVALTATLQSAFPLPVNDIVKFALTQLKEELVARGLPSEISLRLLSFSEKSATSVTTTTPRATTPRATTIVPTL